MGRKIPAKKHRGVKDPLIQQARRLQSLKGKINAPPKDPDEQPVPRSLTQLFAFQNKNQDLVKKKEKKNCSTNASIKTSAGGNPISKLKQLPGETGRGFSLRINSAIRALNEPTDHLDYPMLQEEDREDGRGAFMEDWRERRRQKKKKRDGNQQQEPRLGRVQRLAVKKQERKKAKEEASRPELVYERVSFGEVTHAPPALPPPRHGKTTGGAQRPGRRQLLLTGILTGAAGAAGGGAEIREKERREQARLDVVAAYRTIKKQKRLEANKTRTRGKKVDS
ncbi:hypothetical protein KGM_201165 [Danaus plexippus plexippus]|uniref:Uncharacterized protein n=1 Tax=Danaus plexippus plexippus TaxID=278856 RepID=A0A212F967_DANPL|nr:hypothetical protein KGM_201165 [Danaus plexippus plexippus]